MKYIDADKLKAEIYKHIGKYDGMLHEWSIPVVQGKREEAFSILTIAETLQEEQPKWKPSKEQMKALNAVANEGVLLDLFNDLLKLFLTQ